MNSFLRKSGIFAFVLLLANLFFSGATFAQTIFTDQADYAPGATVAISGSGYLAGETVTLQVIHHLANGDNDTVRLTNLGQWLLMQTEMSVPLGWFHLMRTNMELHFY